MDCSMLIKLFNKVNLHAGKSKMFSVLLTFFCLCLDLILQPEIMKHSDRKYISMLFSLVSLIRISIINHLKKQTS